MASRKNWKEKYEQDGSGFVEVTLNSWLFFSEYINKEMLNFTDYIYRGQANSEWILEPTIDRKVKSPTSKLREAHLEKFKYSTRGRRSTNPPKLDCDNDWWALGQHHGLETPLLDWTESPFVALYFAVTGAIEENSDICSVFSLSKVSVSEINEKINLDSNIEEINNQKPTVKIFSPLSDENARLVSQRGLFTRAPNNMDLESWVKKYNPKTSDMDLIKINIPRSGLEDCLRNLNRMNINSLTLFPDLFGASMYCNQSLEIENY